MFNNFNQPTNQPHNGFSWYWLELSKNMLFTRHSWVCTSERLWQVCTAQGNCDRPPDSLLIIVASVCSPECKFGPSIQCQSPPSRGSESVCSLLTPKATGGWMSQRYLTTSPSFTAPGLLLYFTAWVDSRETHLRRIAAQKTQRKLS